MAAQQSVALKHWARIIKQWPVDKVRPEHVAFQKVMQHRLKELTSPTAAADNVKADGALVTPANPTQPNQENEMRQINALYSLLEDRYLKEYPMPSKVRHPASRPTYYEDLVKEMGEAPTRTWAASMWNRISGMLRFS
ncbi:hypothetical protein PV05_06805 [Exophiala xenobiotica]|uniref:Uncharacterized protein n=1 Tax=Exophiala xenobiotica TaxID=348802 RepID=A0A0D2EG84_9EURO|nr:uncharacterized protein PV05_06805 [Exophiala xenobiotica]KIW54448.1 hypothetical protein PV05_06805 [Exophiala xenobiotica]